VISYHGSVSYTRADSRYTLVTSQALVQDGTIAIDSYMVVNGGELSGDNRRFREINGHYYLYFPIGSSIVAAPAVWIANRFGMDMVRYQDENKMQRVLAALSVGLTFVALVLIAFEYLGLGPAFVLAFFFAYGGPVISIGGTAYRSHNTAMLLNSLVILSIVREEMGRRRLFHPTVLGALLAFGYVCRPTTGSLIVAAGLFFLFARPMRDALLAGLGGVLLLSAFSAWSWMSLERPLPPYYMPSRLAGKSIAQMWVPFLGLTISPSRGVFVFMPFLTVAVGAVPWVWMTARRRPLFWLGTGWAAFHLVMISRFPGWWGGATYGPRFFTDVTPGLLLVALEVWSVGSQTWSRKWFCAWVAILSLGGAAGLYMHSYKGLYAPAIKAWHRVSGAQHHHERFFDWRYPVFLHKARYNDEVKEYWKNKERGKRRAPHLRKKGATK
jgi:hypothetical protein